MKKIFTIVILFSATIGGFNRIYAQSNCVNADFSLDNFTNWKGSVGENTTGSGGNEYTVEVDSVFTQADNAIPLSPGQQTIMTTSATDINTGNMLNVLPAGGAYSCRLGNEQVQDDGSTSYPAAARLKYTYLINASNYVFTYQYAAILQNPGSSHSVTQMPKFTIYFYNALGTAIDSNIVIAQSGLPGWFQNAPDPAADDNTSDVVWCNWQTVSTNLSAWAGQTITIVFTAYDCTLGGHFGYAYISCYCGTNSYQLVQQCLGTSVQVTAPSGFSSYLWNTGDTTSSITLLSPISGDTVTCICTDTSSVIDTLSTIITAPPVFNLSSNVSSVCTGDTAIITASGSYSYLWSTGQTGPSISVSPTATTAYTVTVNAPGGGCTATASITISASPSFPADICIVTVDTSSNHNVVMWEKPVTGAINEYYIYRESAVAGIYNLIGIQNYSNLSEYIDSTSNSLQQSYRYELAINDTCGNTSVQSAYHQTIHLSINAGMSGEWNLIWNDYLGFTFSTYNIYRGTNEGNLTLLDSVASSVTSYTDLTPPAGTVYYMVAAVKPTACILSQIKSTFISTMSNVANAESTGIKEFDSNGNIQISPNPGNGIFTLSLQHVSNQNSEVEIYNSLGQLMKTNAINNNKTLIDISEFSNGVYIVELKSEKGIELKKFIKE